MIAADIKEIPRFLCTDASEKKCETLIKEIEKYQRLFRWPKEVCVWILGQKIDGKIYHEIAYDDEEPWPQAKNRLRYHYGSTFGKLMEQYESFNRQPAESIKTAVSRLFRILNAEKFEFKELPPEWKETLLRKKLQKIMSPDLFQKFYTYWDVSPRYHKKTEVFSILNRFDAAFGHDISGEISADLQVNNISTEPMQPKKLK